MKKALLKKIIIAALVVVVIGGGGFAVYNNFFKTKATASTRYMTEYASTGTLNVTVAGTGTVVSASTKDIIIPNSGIVSGMSIANGTVVKAGQTLGTIEDTTLQNQINSDRAKLTSSQQQVTQATQQKNATLQADQLKLTEAQQKLSNDQAQLNLDNSKTTTNGSSNSAQNPAQTLLNDQTAVQNDQNSITAAEEAITNDTNSGNNNIASANASVSQAQATLNTDLASQNNDTITAPISGTIENLTNQNGDSLQSGKTLATIMDLTHMQLQVPVDELDISKVKVGQTVNITVDDVPGKTYSGTVATVPDQGTTTNNVTDYTVIVNINDCTGLKLGMNANVTINVQSKSNVLMVPSEAITTRNGSSFVMVPASTSSNSGNSNTGNSSNGSSKRGGFSSAGKLVQVQTGISNQDYVEVTSGLSDGEKVLVQLPNVSTTSSSSGRSGGFGGGSFGGGSFGGGSGFGSGTGSSGSKGGN